MSPEWASVLQGPAWAAGGSLVTALGNYLAKRHTSPSRKAQDFETIVTGFQKLVDDLQAECTRLGEKAEQMSAKVDLLTATVETLIAHTDKLESTIRELGATPPVRPHLRVAGP